MAAEKEKNKKEMDTLTAEKDEEMRVIREERDTALKKLEEFEKEMNMKMTEIKIMKMEL